MSLNKTWLGIAIGGGVAAGYGKAGHIIQFVNCAQPTNLVSCVVGGVRVGAALHANCGVSFVLMTGVGGPKDLERATGGGYDFAIDLGIRFGEIVKSGGYIGMAIEDGIKELDRLFLATDLAAWIGSERGKAFINALAGELAPSNTKPTLCIFGSPAGAGLGAGIWYEWQSVYQIGAMEAWACVPLSWRLMQSNGNLWLQIKDIPAKNGSEVVVFGKEFSYGIDGVIQFAEPENIQQTPGTTLRYRSTSTGIVQNNVLQEKPKFQSGRSPAPQGGGINLSVRSLGGVRGVLGGLSEIPANSVLNLGLGIRHQGQLVWEGYQSAKLYTSGKGGVSPITPTSVWAY